MPRKTGTVVWFDKKKGYGFIEPDVSDRETKDDFFHRTAVEASPIDDSAFVSGLRLEYEISKHEGRPTAVDLRHTEAPARTPTSSFSSSPTRTSK